MTFALIGSCLNLQSTKELLIVRSVLKLADWLAVLIVGIILVAIGYILKRVMTESIIKKLGYVIEIIGIVVIIIAIILLVVAFV